MSIAVAVASVNCALKVKPSASKKSIERWRSFTGMLTNSLRGVAGLVPTLVGLGAGAWAVDMSTCWSVDGLSAFGLGRQMMRSWRVKEARDRSALAKDGADARVAEVQAAPDERRDVDRGQDVREQGVAEPEVGHDRAAEVAGPEHGADGRGARDEVEDEADGGDDADHEHLLGREAELRASLDRRLGHGELDARVEGEQHRDDPGEDASGDHGAAGRTSDRGAYRRRGAGGVERSGAEQRGGHGVVSCEGLVLVFTGLDRRCPENSSVGDAKFSSVALTRSAAVLSPR